MQTCFKCGRHGKHCNRTLCQFHPFSKHPSIFEPKGREHKPWPRGQPPNHKKHSQCVFRTPAFCGKALNHALLLTRVLECRVLERKRKRFRTRCFRPSNFSGDSLKGTAFRLRGRSRISDFLRKSSVFCKSDATSSVLHMLEFSALKISGSMKTPKSGTFCEVCVGGWPATSGQ